MRLYFEDLVNRGMSEGRAKQFAEIISELHSCLCHLDSNNLGIAKHVENELYKFALIEELRNFNKPAEYTLEFAGANLPIWESLCREWGNLLNENNEIYVGVEDLYPIEVLHTDGSQETVDLVEYFGLTTTHVCFYR